MVNNHWVWYNGGKPFIPNEDKFGFVYVITNTKTTKAYVGCKQYYSMGKRKTKHKWEMYTGSSKYLNKDIEKIGKKYFTFEVIAEYKNKRSLRYYEMYYQVKWNVLMATIEGSNERAYYNAYVGGKFFPPIEMYQDPDFKKRISNTLKDYFSSEEVRDRASNSNNHLKKPVRCTKENGDVVIFYGSREILKAGYDDSVIHKLAKGGKQTRKDRPNGKGYTIRKKHKDIIKVEFI
tara:strand:+ start:6371 stop:7072 length:702 start_codon:yes stop_codon:yes gene_type:complete